MQALTRHMELHKDVDLASISKSCEYFTGADFKALLYNAQLEAIHEHHGSLLFATGQRIFFSYFLLFFSLEDSTRSEVVDLILDLDF